MDVFVEQLVKVRGGARRAAAIVLLTVAALAIIAGALWFLGSLAAIPIALAGYGWWWLVRMLGLEYEYCVTNGDIDIDMIRGKSRRQRLVSVHGDKIESLAPDHGEDLSRFDRVVVCTSREAGRNIWRFTYRSKKNGHTVVLFEPEERLLKALADGLPYALREEVRRQYGV